MLQTELDSTPTPDTLLLLPSGISVSGIRSWMEKLADVAYDVVRWLGAERSWVPVQVLGVDGGIGWVMAKNIRSAYQHLDTTIGGLARDSIH